MARQVLPWVGMAIGSMVGAPQIGFMVGSLIGNAIDPQVFNGPKLGEGQDNQASEGGYRPIVLGKGAVGVCMIHEGPLKKRPIRHKQSKGGGPVTTEERAYRTMAFALGESAYPDRGVVLTRLWIDNKLRYDVTPGSQIMAESAEFESEFTFYPGDNNQQPDPDLEAFMGAGNVPSYRGGAPYIVFPDWDVTDSRGMAPMIKAELVSSAFAVNAFAMTGNAGKVYTTDDPLSWVNSESIPVANPRGMYVGGAVFTIIGQTEGRASTDGTTFNPISGLPTSGVANGHIGLFCEASQLWLCGSYSDDYGRIFRSSDGLNYVECNAEWSQFGSAPVLGCCIGNVVLFKTLNGIWRSVDGGYNFSKVGRPGAGIGGIVSLIATSSGFVAAATDGKIYKSPTGASTGSWVEVGASAHIGASLVGGSAYDPQSGIVCIVCNGGVTLWSGSDGNGPWVVGEPHGFSVVAFNDQSNNLIYHDGWFLVAQTGSGLNGEIRATQDLDAGPWITVKPPEQGGQIRGMVVGKGAYTAEAVLLSDVIQFLHSRAELPTWKSDLSQLTDEVEGIVFADGYTAADAIRTQMALYFFDAGEFDAGSGYRINYVKRGGAASVTLTEADIVDGPEDWEREDSYERPRALHVAYQNPVADYGAPNITIKRTSPDVLVVGERSASVPNVFSDVDEITQRADIMMTVIYSEIAGTYEITLPVSWLELAPTDCIGFSIRGRTRRLRLTNWRFSPDGTIKTEWMADRQSAYTSNVTGLPVVPPTPPPPSIVGPTVSAVLDIPALVDALDSLHVVLAASGQTEAWYGSIHQRKLPSDADYATMAQFSAPTTIMGTLQVAVSAASPHYTDTTNVVRVKLYSDDDLDTYTQEQFLSEHGAFALAWDDGGVRRWEVCQYRDAVKVGDMEWELTTLLRGRLNTEVEAHPIGSLFVLLDSGIRVAPAQSSWIGQDITHRAVSNGQLPDNAVPYVETYTGESQREWPVAHVFLDLVGDNLAVDIVPRHRFGTDDHPVRSLNWDGYRIEATDGVNSDSITTASDTATIDVTGWSGTITVTVAQLNRITGAGPTVSETIEA